MVTERYTKSFMGESNPPVKIMTSTKSCHDDLCLGTNHLRLQPFNMILIIKLLKNRKYLNLCAGPGRDRRFLVYRVSAPEIPDTSGKRGLPSPPGSLLPCFGPELPAPLYFPLWIFSSHNRSLNISEKHNTVAHTASNPIRVYFVINFDIFAKKRLQSVALSASCRPHELMD